MTVDIDPNAHDVFLLRQKWTMVINRYFFSLPDARGREGQRFAFVEQARFKFKEDIRFFADESHGRELLADQGPAAVRPGRPLRHHRPG